MIFNIFNKSIVFQPLVMCAILFSHLRLDKVELKAKLREGQQVQVWNGFCTRKN